MNRNLRELHQALSDLAGVLNRPQPGLALMHEAGISLDRILLPLLVRIERSGPIGIVELGELSDRDYNTVTRQVTKLESLGLALRRIGSVDRRVREVVITPAGLALTGEVDLAREKLSMAVLATWSPDEIHEFARLCRKFVDALAGMKPADLLRTQETRESCGEGAPPPARRRGRREFSSA
jgi:DNA-binding MarR family transcriptional regulator